MISPATPRLRRCLETWTTEFETPFARGRNDSAAIAIRMLSLRLTAVFFCAREYEVSLNLGGTLGARPLSRVAARIRTPTVEA